MNETIEAARKALGDWPICVHPRLGLGPTYDDIARWFGKHANTLHELLESATRQNAGAVDINELIIECYKHFKCTTGDREDQIHATHILETVNYLAGRGLIESHEGAGSAGEHKAALSQPENLDLPEDNR